MGALLNLIPGFGLGYLLVGRRRGFLVSLLGWIVPGAVVIYSLIVAASLCYDPDAGLACLGLAVPIIGGLALGLGINLLGAIHLLISALGRPLGRGKGVL